MAAKKVLLLCGDYMEDYEAMVPFQALQAYGVSVDAVCPGKKAGDACRTAVHQGTSHQTYSETRGHNFALNASFDEINVAEYDGLVIPGGRAPEYLAIDEKVLDLVRKFSDTKKPIASVCHGQLILAAAAVVRNRTCTAYPAVKPVLVAAGAKWEEADTMAKCLADGNLITAAAYDAHPEFISLFVKALGGSVAGLNKRIWFLSGKYFLAGVVDGLNNRVDDLVAFVEKNKLVVSTYCSLMHTVVDLARETGMIHGYGFVGEMDKAVKLIDGMVLTGWKPNAFICSTLLDGYCKEVRTVDATTLFKEMLGKGINPGAITYIILLDGLFKTWRTAVAKEFLKSLKVVYKLQLPKGVGIHRVSHVSQLKIHCGPKVITSPDLSLVIKEDKLRVEPISVMEIIVLLRDRLVRLSAVNSVGNLSPADAHGKMPTSSMLLF